MIQVDHAYGQFPLGGFIVDTTNSPQALQALPFAHYLFLTKTPSGARSLMMGALARS